MTTEEREPTRECWDMGFTLPALLGACQAKCEDVYLEIKISEVCMKICTSGLCFLIAHTRSWKT